ncbi:YphA family membrane protein [Sutcliffiella horikoshii]|uniref:YphA family membrane protein n=1 Tax=Sutcliffiella horikoshii TaxID=79883 RepID=UPI003CFB51AB
METTGQYFYFLSWMGWIIVTFFFPKSAIRTNMSILLLVVIACSTTTVQMFGFTITASFLVLVVTALIMLVNSLRQKYILHYFSICTVALAYVCFIIFEIYDPVWIFLDRTWLLSVIILYLSLLLFKTKRERFVFMLTGVLLGEVLRSIVTDRIFSYSDIGSFEFLAVLALSSAGMATWMMFETLTIHLDSLIQKRVRERQG